MGLYSGGLIIGRIFASDIWRTYFREGLFLEGLIIGILRYVDRVIVYTHSAGGVSHGTARTSRKATQT